ncbi:hypothetical protein [Flavobacterium sp.]|uniref:energy transducer TonB n=1 Tax=Flavobacterium sp. TaxID=239 RepID=UPI00286E616C|nr:hypothetical protein [Flavobacterium sp.]
MKKLLLLLFVIFSNITFAQTEPKKFKDKFAEFEYYAKPSKTNDLSKYFKQNINYTLLENYKFKDTLKKNSSVVLSFKLDKNNNVIDLVVNSPYLELNFFINNAFENYNVKKINIPEKSPLNLYTLQILSREGNKMVVNCSSDIVYDRFPIFEGCESSTTFSETKSCFTAFLEDHFAKNISTDLIKKEKMLGKFNLKPEFIVTESGAIEKVKWKTSSDSLHKETNRIMALFPQAKIPPTRNGKPTRLYISELTELEIQSKNKNHIEKIIKAKDTTLNPNCELALHFKKYITEEEISNYILPTDWATINIGFSLDKKRKIINLKTSAKNKILNKKLVGVFKKFPFEKLNIKQPNVLESYYYTIFTVEKKVIIECHEKPNVFSQAYFDEKCGKSNSPKDLIKCFQKKMRIQIVKNINPYLFSVRAIVVGNKKNLAVQVDVDGTISRISTLGSYNPTVEEEWERIRKKMPKVYKPAFRNGVPIKNTYIVPISF